MAITFPLPQIGFGAAPLGNLFTPVTDQEAAAALQLAHDMGVRMYDTAPQYGLGLSELRLAKALATWTRSDIVLSTKVGRIVDPNGPEALTSFVDLPHPNRFRWDYSADGIKRSIEESCKRLDVDYLDIVYVHDPDSHEIEATDEAFPALIELREQGVIGAIGAGMNQFEMLTRFVERIDLDCILLAGRWTLLDKTGEALLDLCGTRNVQVICGGVFNSGVLAAPNAEATFDYQRADGSLVAQAQKLGREAEAKGSSLIAEAIKFPFTHPAVSSVLLGMRSVSEVTTNLRAAQSAGLLAR
jgi:D-threo-aldose 1-dehydrogenase